MLGKAKKKTVKFRKAPQAPKRGKTAFILFSMAKHPEMRTNKQDGTPDKVPNVAKRVSEAWRKLSREDRAYWEEEARKDKMRYEVEKTMYTGPWKLPAGTGRAKKDPDAPKRPMSSFLAFSKENRRKVKEENPGMSNLEISKVLAAMWKNASEKERSVFIKKEEKERAVYIQEINRWRAARNEEIAKKRKRREDLAREAMEKGVSCMFLDQSGRLPSSPSTCSGYNERSPHYVYGSSKFEITNGGFGNELAGAQYPGDDKNVTCISTASGVGMGGFYSNVEEERNTYDNTSYHNPHNSRLRDGFSEFEHGGDSTKPFGSWRSDPNSVSRSHDNFQPNVVSSGNSSYQRSYEYGSGHDGYNHSVDYTYDSNGEFGNAPRCHTPRCHTDHSRFDHHAENNYEWSRRVSGIKQDEGEAQQHPWYQHAAHSTWSNGNQDMTSGNDSNANWQNQEARADTDFLHHGENFFGTHPVDAYQGY